MGHKEIEFIENQKSWLSSAEMDRFWNEEKYSLNRLPSDGKVRSAGFFVIFS